MDINEHNETLLKNICLNAVLEHVTLEDIAKDWPMGIDNNLQSWTNDYCSALYGNRELLLYIGDIEEPFTYCIDIYGDKLILVET